jgi:N-acetylglucosaminyldiphosphoundecaprenol N-acetyl-beta-D-mannosaminyltransferase
VTKAYSVLGTDINPLSLDEGLHRAQDLINSDQAHYIALPYVEFIMRAKAQPKVASVLADADLKLPNGVGLNWAIHYLYGGPHNLRRWLSSGLAVIFRPRKVHDLAPGRFSSGNFTWPLLEWCAANHKTICLIGSPKSQSIEHTARHLQSDIHGLDIVGTYPGRFGKAAEIRLIEELKQLGPDLILVGMGFPAQELLMHRLKAQLSHGLMIGEGGSFDYQQFGGQVKRAPGWLQTIGLEWLWRLLREPSRLRRQLVIPKFIWQVYLAGRNRG